MRLPCLQPLALPQSCHPAPGGFGLVASPGTPLSVPAPRLTGALSQPSPTLWSASRLFRPHQDRTLLKLWQRVVPSSCPWKPWEFSGPFGSLPLGSGAPSCPTAALWLWVGHCFSGPTGTDSTVCVASVPSHTHGVGGACVRLSVASLSDTLVLGQGGSSGSGNLCPGCRPAARPPCRSSAMTPGGSALRCHRLSTSWASRVGECSPDPAHTRGASARKGGGAAGGLHFSESRRASRRRCQPSQAFEDECQNKRGAECFRVPGSGPSTGKARPRI